MNHRLDRRGAAWLPAALTALLCAAILWTGALDTQRTWTEMVYTCLRFPSGSARDAGGGENYGPMNTGPGLDLPPGTYRLKWIVEADGVNRLLIRAENGARIVPDELTLSPERRTDEAEFTVLEQADGVQLVFSFDGGSTIDAIDLRLYSPFYRDHAFTLALLLIAACALWTMRKRIAPEGRGRFLLCAFAVLLASAPSFRDNLVLGHDTEFHLARLMNLADALASGQFPARVGGFTYNGYGAATSVFYPDFFLYPFATLVNAGASVPYAMHLMEIALNASAAAAMYALAKRVLGDADTATCACVLYTLASYRLTDVYIRCALGEALAMSVLPVFLLGLWETLFGDKRRWPILAAGAAGVCLSHALSTALCAALALAAAVLCLPRIMREKRFAALVKAALLAAGLCMFWFVPFILYSMEGIGADVLRGVVPFEPIAPAQLLFWSAGELAAEPFDVSLTRAPVEIGFPLLLGALLTLWRLAANRTEGPETRGGRDALRFLFMGAASALAATTLFPWSYVRLLTGGLSDFLQFPWRTLMLADALLAVPAAYGFARFAGKRGDAAAVAALALCAVFALPTLSAQARKGAFVEFGEGARTALTYPEYQLPGTDVSDVDDRNPHAEGVIVTGYEKNGTRVFAHVEAAEDASLSLPLFGFTGYAASLDGERVPWTRGENNRLTVAISAGTDAELRVWFEGVPLWHVGDAVSLMALALWIVMLHRMRRKTS